MILSRFTKPGRPCCIHEMIFFTIENGLKDRFFQTRHLKCYFYWSEIFVENMKLSIYHKLMGKRYMFVLSRMNQNLKEKVTLAIRSKNKTELEMSAKILFFLFQWGYEFQSWISLVSLGLIANWPQLPQPFRSKGVNNINNSEIIYSNLDCTVGWSYASSSCSGQFSLHLSRNLVNKITMWDSSPESKLHRSFTF